MNKPQLTLITRVSRLSNLRKVKESIFPCKEFKVNWKLIVDCDAVREVDTELLMDIFNHKNIEVSYVKGQKDYLHTSMSKVISKVTESWVYILDDDNLIHPELYSTLSKLIKSKKKIKAFVFNQFIDGKDFTGEDYRFATPSNMKVGHVDSAQILFHSSIFKEYIPPVYVGDGMFIEELYRNNKSNFFFVDKTLSFYNRLAAKESIFHLPKILYIGDKNNEMKSIDHLGYFDTRLNVKSIKTDENIDSILSKFNPDSIITDTKDPLIYSNLAKKSHEVRRKWYNYDKRVNIGEVAYNVAMNAMLSRRQETLVSFFTSAYNTKTKLYQTFYSLQKQTYQNWEWVIVNDSNDGNRTLSIIEELAKLDSRVKIYEFRERTRGIIGEAKYRAACLTNGEVLAELDHDDVLTSNCALDLVNAYTKYPQCGFYYGDSAEILPDNSSARYPEGFCFGYGEYYKQEWNGKYIDVQLTPNINPITIRHIVGVPNHIRAWRRDLYFKIGGHNRGLTIADDYELLVRTFLHTIFCKIPKLTYIQYLYNDSTGVNTHETSRADIQRRVFTIQNHYNEDIKNRFEQLGLEDWAYSFNPTNPLLAPPRKGKEENKANIIWTD